MRIERLEISGIGPYAGREAIDFEELNDAGVCLLTGPTGAGKSTILDAITFALYGTVPRANKGSELVSHLRKLETTAEVVLEATIGGKTLRITRVPKHTRPASRGEGTAEQKQTALVEEFDAGTGEWEQRADKWKEADEFIEDLIGMSDDQFSQVVLLPQGKFAEFLNADPTARHELLNTLFPGVELDALEAWFEKRSKADEAARAAKEAEIRDSLTKVDPVLDRLHNEHPEIEPRPESILESTPIIEWTERTREVLSTRWTAAEKVAGETRAAADRDEKALGEANLRKERIQRRRDCEESLAGLRTRAEWRTASQTELDAGRRAALVTDRIAMAGELEVRLASVSEELRQAQQAMDSIGLDPTLSGDELRVHRTEVAGQLAAIAAFEEETAPELDRLVSESDELEEEAAALESGDSKELVNARTRFEKAESDSKDLKKRLIEVRDLRTRGMAAELAGQLEPGDPCMVCGSTEHPSPARPGEHGVDQEQEEEATEAVEEADRVLDAARRELEEVTTGLETRKATVKSRLESLKGQITAAGEKEAELKGDQPTLAARRDLLDRRQMAIQRVVSAMESASTAGEQLGAAKLAAKRALEENGFETEELALAASRSSEDLEALEKAIKDYDRQLSEGEGLLKGELAGVDPSEEVDVTPYEEAAIRSTGARDEALRQLQQATTDRADFDSNAGQVPGLYEELAPLREAADRSGELFKLTSGKAGSKLRLSTFVLAARLRNVIQAANHHLATMSSGKYEIRFDPSATGKQGSAGLGLEIYDFHSSKTRKTSTLSGGESFYASLALALGLAEVVQSESGGRPLETLFIDEGFGSLDADTLDQVMDVIDSLRDGGRTVALVSHVEEMKSRIPARIVISSSPEGSSLKVESGV